MHIMAKWSLAAEPSVCERFAIGAMFMVVATWTVAISHLTAVSPILLAETATCTAASSPGGSFTDPTSTFVGCTITGWADFNFGSVASTAVALSLLVSGSTVQAGQRLSIAGFASLTAHQPLNATIVDSTFSNSALRIAGTFPAGTTITVLRTVFTLLDTKLSVGQNIQGPPAYMNPNIFFSSVVLRDKSHFFVAQCTISNIKNLAGAAGYNIVTIHSPLPSDLMLSNYSSVVFTDSVILARSQGADAFTWSLSNLGLNLLFSGGGNAVQFLRCNLTTHSDNGHAGSSVGVSLTAATGTTNPPEPASIGASSAAVRSMPSFASVSGPHLSSSSSALLSTLASFGVLATSAVVFSGCRISNYGWYNGYSTNLYFPPGTFLLFEDNVVSGSRGTIYAGETQNLLSIGKVTNITVLLRHNTFDASASLMRHAIWVGGSDWQSFNLILYRNRATLNYEGLIIIGTPTLPSGVTSTPITVHLIENTVTGSATPRPLLQGYAAPHETVYACRNTYYGNRLVLKTQYISGTGVTDVAASALRYGCGSATVSYKHTVSASKIYSVTKSQKPTATPTSSKSILETPTLSANPSATRPLTRSATADSTPSHSVEQSQTKSGPVETRSLAISGNRTASPPLSVGSSPSPTATSPGATPSQRFPNNRTKSTPISKTLVPTVATFSTTHKTSTTSKTAAASKTAILNRTKSSIPSFTATALETQTRNPTKTADIPRTPSAPITLSRELTRSPLCPDVPSPGTTNAWLAPSSPSGSAAFTAAGDVYRILFVPPPSAVSFLGSDSAITHQAIEWESSIAHGDIAAQLPTGTSVAAATIGHCTLAANTAAIFEVTCSLSGELVRAILRANPDRTSTLHARVATGPCDWSLSLTLVIQPASGSHAASTTVVIIIAVAATTALLTALVDPTAIDAQLITVVLLSACSHHGGGARVSRYLLSPLIDLGPAVVALAHTWIAITVTGLHLLAAAVTAHRRKISFSAACSTVHFPSASFSLSSLLYAGAAWGTAAAIHSIGASTTSTSTDLAAVACAVLLLLLPEPVLCASALLRTAARRHRFVTFRSRYREATTDEPTSRTPRGPLASIFLPFGAWEVDPVDEVEAPVAVGSLRGLAGPRAPLLLVTMRLLFLLCCALITAPPRSGTCKGRLHATAAILAVSAVVILITRPFRVHATTALSAALALTTALLAVASAESHEGLTNAAIVLASVCAVLRGVHTAVVLMWEHRQCKQHSAENSNKTALLEVL